MSVRQAQHNILVRRPRELTVCWAQAVLAQHHAAVTVKSVTVRAVDVGTTTRVRLAVEHDGPATLARRWFVKLPSLSWRARAITALSRLLHMEVRFYNEVAASVPITTPVTLAAVRQLGRGVTLVLADVTETGAVAGQPQDALSIAQARAVIEQLALLHIRYWGDPSLETTFGWLAGPVRRLEDGLGSALAVPLMQRGLRQAGRVIPRRLHQEALQYARHRRQVMQQLSQGPLTLVHHDCHPGNLFWQGGAPGLLDWQLVRIGEGIGDVAYFLATALAADVRRQYQEECIAQYHTVLLSHGIALPSLPDLYQRYRAHLTYAFEAMVVTLAVGGLMEVEANVALLERAAVAADELDAFGAIFREPSHA